MKFAEYAPVNGLSGVVSTPPPPGGGHLVTVPLGVGGDRRPWGGGGGWTWGGEGTWCAAREPVSPDPKARKFSRASRVCAHVVRGVPCASTTWELHAIRARNFQLQIVQCQGT